MTNTTNTQKHIDSLALVAARIQTEQSGDMDASAAARLRAAAELIRLAQEMLTNEARYARSLGTTWAEIGDAIGTTRQNAQQRFRSNS